MLDICSKATFIDQLYDLRPSLSLNEKQKRDIPIAVTAGTCSLNLFKMFAVRSVAPKLFVCKRYTFC